MTTLRYRDRTKRSAIVLTDCFTCGTTTTTTPEGPTDMTARMIKLWKDNRLDGEWEITLVEDHVQPRPAMSPTPKGVLRLLRACVVGACGHYGEQPRGGMV